MLTSMRVQAGRYCAYAGSHAETSTLREFPGGVTRRCRYGGGHLVAPGPGLSLVTKTASAFSPCRSLTTGMPLIVGRGPNMVARLWTAIVDVPSAAIAARMGQPLRRHGAAARLVKRM